jgi:hypothetical protein
MSEAATGAGFLAWQRLKLGWLDPSQIACATEPGRAVATLTPLETPGGLKAVVARSGPASFTVAELRRPLGADSGLCGNGVLVYDVSTVPLGPAPIRVLRPAGSDDRFRFDRCGPAWNATLARR